MPFNKDSPNRWVVAAEEYKCHGQSSECVPIKIGHICLRINEAEYAECPQLRYRCTHCVDAFNWQVGNNIIDALSDDWSEVLTTLAPPPLSTENSWVIASVKVMCGNGHEIEAGEIAYYLPKGKSSLSIAAWRCRKCIQITHADMWTEVGPIPAHLLNGSVAPPVKIPQLMSFSYSAVGGPPSGFYIIDVRKTVKNPWRVAELRKLNGLDKAVQEYVGQCQGAADAKGIAMQRLRKGHYIGGYHNCNVAVGCQDGKHRSVAIVELTAMVMREIYPDTMFEIVHRDLKLKGKEDSNNGESVGGDDSIRAGTAVIDIITEHDCELNYPDFEGA